MKIKKLKLFTNKIEEEYLFYSEILGFEILEKSKNSFTVKIGWSELSFEKSEQEFLYHYCFLLSSNHLSQALAFMEKRTTVINIEDSGKIQRFEHWNADSFYFYDASGNIAELIVRHDLKNLDESEFDISKILGINEIGLPTRNLKTTNDQLIRDLKTEFWKGDLERFGTNGSQEGLFLLPNYKLKDVWFPSSIKIKPNDFEAIIENLGKNYLLLFKNEKLEISEYF